MKIIWTDLCRQCKVQNIKRFLILTDAQLMLKKIFLNHSIRQRWPSRNNFLYNVYNFYLKINMIYAMLCSFILHILYDNINVSSDIDIRIPFLNWLIFIYLFIDLFVDSISLGWGFLTCSQLLIYHNGWDMCNSDRYKYDFDLLRSIGLLVTCTLV